MRPHPDFDTASFCFHCGLPVPAGANWIVTISREQRNMCCPGCQAVAEAIVASGCADYYSSRSDYSATASGRDDLLPAQLQAYDIAAEKLIDTSSESIFSIEGLRCAACVWLIERRLSALPGIQSVHINVSSEKLRVQWDSAYCQPSLILQTLYRIGYTAHPFDALKHGEMVRRNGKQLFRQLFIAGLAMMQVMMYAFPAYLASGGSIEEDHAQLLRWASLFLTLPAVCYSALPFYRGAWFNMRSLSLGMDVPVTIGILAAFAASVVATWSNRGQVYFDSVTMFI
ncbi:heavy metal translocating P-type ATPase metal-binding domain-containing protein, partial [Undibacterium sp.]|uniref:heavy metal translocating P-type ATPase metal-binding domain-containing protein n=1 Tax=Undibacterium sp. TaxID=1914977 RepID=UPI002BB98663